MPAAPALTLPVPRPPHDLAEDPGRALAVIAALLAIDARPGRQLWDGQDVTLVAADICRCWQRTRPAGTGGLYRGGLAGYAADYVADVDQAAAPGGLRETWAAHLRRLRRPARG